MRAALAAFALAGALPAAAQTDFHRAEQVETPVHQLIGAQRATGF